MKTVTSLCLTRPEILKSDIDLNQNEIVIRDKKILGDITYSPKKSSSVICFHNCKFSTLIVRGNCQKLKVQNCEFDEISIQSSIKHITIDNTESEVSKIEFTQGTIEELLLYKNRNIKLVECRKDYNVKINKITCEYSSIKRFQIEVICDVLSFGELNRIDTLDIAGELNSIQLNSRWIFDHLTASVYNIIEISNRHPNSKLDFSGIIAAKIYINNYLGDSHISLHNVRSNGIFLWNCNLKEGQVTIDRCNELDIIQLNMANIGTFNIFNSDLSKSLINISRSILRSINWQFVNWPKRIKYYTPSQEDNLHVLETLRILKLHSLNQHDKFNANLFSSLENIAYLEKLKNEKKVYGDKLILWLNHLSNNHGLNPWRGILFTIIICALFFLPTTFLLDDTYWKWGWTNWNDFWEVVGITTELYAKALYAGHSFDFMREFQPKAIVFFLDLIGRIFVAYGYYQTVIAFRKFNRKW